MPESDERKLFWKSGFRICPLCTSTSIAESKTVEGCRYNGDAYGFVTFTCNSAVCCWSSFFRYDDAADVYYYETVTWT